VPFYFVECRTERSVLEARLRAREGVRGVSDGRLALLADFEARFEPVDELEPAVHRVADTTRPLHATIAELESFLPLWSHVERETDPSDSSASGTL
jgi:predicted kinase